MALGATRSSVQGLVLRKGMKMAEVAVAIGLVAALAAMRVLRGLLVGIDSGGSGTIAMGVALVTGAPPRSHDGTAARLSKALARHASIKCQYKI